MVSFTIDSTIDGAVHVFGPNRRIFVRIFWICLFILSIFGIAYYIRGSYLRWKYEPDIIVKTQYQKVSDFSKYAVTVCPYPFQFNIKVFGNITEKLDRIKNERFDKERIKLSARDCSVLDAHDRWCNEIDEYANPNTTENGTLDNPEDNIFDESVLGVFEALGTHKDPNETIWKKYCEPESLSRNWTELSSILLKAYDGFEKLINFGNRSSKNVLTFHGACTTYRMSNLSIFKEEWMDNAYGLMNDDITLNSDETQEFLQIAPVEQICYTSNTYFKVIVHQRNEIPTSALIWTCTIFQLERDKPEFYMQNLFKKIRFHETIEVQHGERAEIVIGMKSHSINKNMQAVDPEARKCFLPDEGHLKKFKRYSKYYCHLECVAEKSKCDPLEVPKANLTALRFCGLLTEFSEEADWQCKCYPECNFVQYELRKEVIEEGDSENSSTIITFRYESDLVHETEQIYLHAVEQFIAEIGGFLGLFLGVSLLSIAEIFVFIACELYRFVSRNRQDKKLNMKNTTERKDEDNNLSDTQSSFSSESFRSCTCKKHRLLIRMKQLQEKIKTIKIQLVSIQKRKAQSSAEILNSNCLPEFH